MVLSIDFLSDLCNIGRVMTGWIKIKWICWSDKEIRILLQSKIIKNDRMKLKIFSSFYYMQKIFSI